MAVFLGLFVGTAGVDGQTSITLRDRIVAREAVTVGDVARVKGTDSDRIGRVIVLDARRVRPGTTTRVEIKDVRRVLSELDGFNWGEVMMRGSGCDVVGPPAAPIEKNERSTSTQGHAAQEVTLALASSIGVGTVRARVAAMLAAYLDVDADKLKVGFRGQDAGLLDRSIDGFAVEVRPMSVSGRIPVRVTLFDAQGERDGASGVVRVEVRVRMETAKAVRAVRRGSVIEAADVEAAMNWMEPGVDWASGAVVIGSSAMGTIEPGQFVRLGQVREPLAIKRGEIVFVRCVSGSVILRSRARATADAKRGEIIALESLAKARSERRRFMAKITGPGQAVVVDEIDKNTGKNTGSRAGAK
jgi:flagella basal body P-ring formation protein FlgA